jgi:hypothetical protein
MGHSMAIQGWDEATRFIAERADLGLMFEVVADE